MGDDLSQSKTEISQPCRLAVHEEIVESPLAEGVADR